MNTPNSTTERGVTDAEVTAAWTILSAHSGGQHVFGIREALEAFAQSRQASAQGGERVNPVTLREVVLSLVEAAKTAALSSAPCDILVHGNATRLLTDGAGINLAAKAEEAEKAICEYVSAFFATPPATSGMKEAVPDDVWEALQRLIENGGSMGPASAADALLVAKHRRILMSTPWLTLDEIEDVLAGLGEDHDGRDFEPECPSCTAYKKLSAIRAGRKG